MDPWNVAWLAVVVVGSWWFSRAVDRWQDDREKAGNARLELERLKLSALGEISEQLKQLVDATAPATIERRITMADVEALRAVVLQLRPDLAQKATDSKTGP